MLIHKRAEIILADEVGNPIEGELDGELWPSLKNHLDSVLSGTYKGLQTSVFMMFRRGRSADDINTSSLRLRVTIQNKLSRFCKTLVTKFNERLKNHNHDDHSSTQLIGTMSKCLDINEMLEKGIDDDEFNERGEENLEKLLNKAQYSKTDRDQIRSEYTLFKAAVKKLSSSDNKGSEYIRMFEHILYKVHECKKNKWVDDGRCQEKNKVLTPKQPIPEGKGALWRNSKFPSPFTEMHCKNTCRRCRRIYGKFNRYP